MNPTGMLKNTATGRFHPIVFREAPMPGDADATMEARRYKSLGHHTAGFDSEAEAMASIEKQPTWKWTGRVYGWDGTDTPAMVEWFFDHELR